MPIDTGSEDPFVRYRHSLESYARARAGGWTDADFVSLVERLDAAIADVEGHGFVMSPLERHPAIATELGLATRDVWLKDDTGNVGGSHKARHLFGVMLHQALGVDVGESELAIASCGNAALAAAVVARSQDRPLRVFIPTWAERPIVEELERLEARIEVCERRPGESGDPAYLRFLEAVDQGATPFSVQSTVTPTTIDGGKTLGWEISEQLGTRGVEGRLRIVVQIGGGAMASAVAEGIADGIQHEWVRVEPVFHPVQTEACAPLYRAWDLLLQQAGIVEGTNSERVGTLGRGDAAGLMAVARSAPDRFMFPWEPVGESAATGILDDVAYDWLGVLGPVFESSGWPVVVDEHAIVRAHELVTETCGISASATGTAGVAGLFDHDLRASITSDESVLALVTGIQR